MTDRRSRTIAFGRLWVDTHVDGQPLARTADELATVYFQAYANDITRHLTATFPTRDVEDAVQDAFVLLHRALTHGEEIDHPRAWVVKVATNRLLDGIRKARFRENLYQNDIDLIVARLVVKTGGSPEDVFLDRQRREALGEALLSLSDIERRCLHKRAEGLTLAQIGRVVDLDLRRVSEILVRAVKTLQEKVRG